MFGLFIFVSVQNLWLGISQCWKFVGSTHFLVLQISLVILQVQPTHPTSEKVPTKWRRLETTQRALRSLGSTVGPTPGFNSLIVLIAQLMTEHHKWLSYVGNDYDHYYEDRRLVENGNGHWVPQGKDEALVWYIPDPPPHHNLDHHWNYEKLILCQMQIPDIWGFIFMLKLKWFQGNFLVVQVYGLLQRWHKHEGASQGKEVNLCLFKMRIFISTN